MSTTTSTATDLALTHVMLLVGDQDEALTFYRDTVGLEVRIDLPFDGGRWLSVGPASQPGLEIVLEMPGMHPTAEGRKAYQERLDSRAQSTVIFYTDDVDATFARLKAAGTEVEQELIDQPYGVRDCGFADPWGNHIRFATPKS